MPTSTLVRQSPTASNSGSRNRTRRALGRACAAASLAAVLAGFGPAAVASAPEAFELPVNFYAEPAPVDNGRSIHELTGWRSVDNHGHTLGLYRQLTRAVVRVEGELLEFGSAALLRPTRASLDISTDHHIYVGAEFPPGSCQYEAALEHERMHEQLHVQAIENLLPELERRVREELRAVPTHAGIPLNRQLAEAAHRAGRLVSQLIAERTRAHHAAFDSPEEYERVQAACDGAMGGALRSARTHIR